MANKQTPLKTPISLRYATPVGNYCFTVAEPSFKRFDSILHRFSQRQILHKHILSNSKMCIHTSRGALVLSMKQLEQRVINDAISQSPAGLNIGYNY